ncbi:MAG: peptide chain release factor 1 [Lachnospiraceae bacterium]|nr:peptide chain release factor 1 [Lachnospiraceae bacterium]
MFESLKDVFDRYEEMTVRLADPGVMADAAAWQRLMKDRAALEPVALAYREYRSCLDAILEMESLLEAAADEELAELASEELALEREKQKELEQKLRLLMIPKDEEDDRNIYMEIRGAVGGEEAALFAGDLYRMYARYAESKGWKVRVNSLSESDLGGCKEIVFRLEGNGVYGRMKFESGVHVVKRIPVTESGGRLHTSTATVAVLPEARDVEVNIDPGDLRIDVYRSSGHGGQSVNTTDSAVRVTHLPTGLVVICQQEKSQLKNRDQAIRELKSRLLEMEKEKARRERSDDRKLQVGTAARSEKIRTYHFMESRVTDHRIGFKSSRVTEIIDGDLDELLDRLMEEEQQEKLTAMGNGSSM